MDSGEISQLVVLVCLLGLSAFFSSAETALVTISRLRIRTLVEEGVKNADKLQKIADNSGKMLSAILIGNNIVNLSASALTTLLAQKWFNNYAVSVATGVLTVFILIFGEITPKTLATVNAEKMALMYAPIVLALMTVLTPVIFVINKLAGLVIRLFGADPNKKATLITETELRTMVDVSHEEGILETEERKLIKNVFDLGDATAKDIMVPRIDMTAVDVEDSYEELTEVFRRDHYTRFPVYEGETDNIIGILNMKDLLLYDKEKEFHIRDFLRDPLFTYESKHLDDLMAEMKKTGINTSIVLDEYGAAAGLVTLEDILEEIVGDIRDEYDYDEEDQIHSVTQTEYIVSGQTRIADINDELELNLSSDEYESLAGIIMEKLDRIPAPGDEVEFDDCILKVLAVERKRVDKIKITKKHQEMGEKA